MKPVDDIPERAWTMRPPRRIRWLAGTAAALALLFPLAQFRFADQPLFLTFWEFVCYRYYGGLSNLAGDLQNLWVVQGFPMALLQHALLALLQQYDPGGVGTVAQLELFAWLTLTLAYAIGAAMLVAGWVRVRLPTIDLAFVSLVTVGLWPLTRYYPYLFAPDYWIFEVPIYLGSCLWTLSVYRSAQRGESPGRTQWLFFPAVGVWMALAFLQKPSLVAYAALPAAVALLYATPTWAMRLVGSALTLAFAGGGHWFVFQAYYRFTPGIGANAYRQYWNWLIHHPETGTSLLTGPQLLQSSGFLLLPIGLGMLTLLVVSAWPARHAGPVPARARLILAYLWLSAAGHLAVISKRPSGTSVVDAMFFGAFLMPIALALVPAARQRLAYGTAIAAIILSGLVYRPVLAGHDAPTWAANALGTIEAIRQTVAANDRPVILLLPDNRLHPHTAEAFGLYTGQLNQHGHAYDAQNLPVPFAETSLRGRLFPQAFMLGKHEQDKLDAAIAAGYLIMWGESSTAPPITDHFPAVAALLANPACSHLRFPILPGDVVIAHLAFRQDARPPP